MAMANSNFGSVSFSAQFDAGSDNSSVTEKLKGSRRSPIVLSELDEHEEFAESGNWGEEVCRYWRP